MVDAFEVDVIDDRAHLRFRDEAAHEEPAVTLDAFLAGQSNATAVRVEPGDEVTLVIPRDIDSDWGSIENVLKKAGNNGNHAPTFADSDRGAEENNQDGASDKNDVLDEWQPDLEELKRELNRSEKDEEQKED